LKHQNVYSSIVLIIHAHPHKFETFGHKAKICCEHLVDQHSHTPTHKTKGKTNSFSSNLISRRSQHAFYPLYFEILLSFPTFSSCPLVKPYHHHHQSGTILHHQLHFQKQQT
jgi:hypothetical protein